MGNVREGNEAGRWGRCQSREVGSWEVLSFVQGWGMQGESKILSFLSDVGQWIEWAGWIQDFLA